jgi:hypothetical protein
LELAAVVDAALLANLRLLRYTRVVGTDLKVCPMRTGSKTYSYKGGNNEIYPSTYPDPGNYSNNGNFRGTGGVVDCPCTAWRVERVNQSRHRALYLHVRTLGDCLVGLLHTRHQEIDGEINRIMSHQGIPLVKACG